MNLEDYDDAYANAEAQGTGDFPEVPDGTYLCSINSCVPSESKTGKAMFKWMFTVLAPEHVGRKIFRNDVLSAEKLGWLKGDFAKLGLELDRLSDYYDKGHEIIGKTVELKVQTKNGDDGKVYRNVFINKCVGDLPDDGVPF